MELPLLLVTQARLGTWPLFPGFRGLEVESEVARFERLAGPIPPAGIPASSCEAGARR